MSVMPDEELERRRIAWQCRRGMRELDEMLLQFMQHRYSTLHESELRLFEQVLDYPDAVLLELLMGRMQAADGNVDRLVRSIRDTAAA